MLSFLGMEYSWKTVGSKFGQSELFSLSFVYSIKRDPPLGNSLWGLWKSSAIRGHWLVTHSETFQMPHVGPKFLFLSGSLVAGVTSCLFGSAPHWSSSDIFLVAILDLWPRQSLEKIAEFPKNLTIPHVSCLGCWYVQFGWNGSFERSCFFWY